MVLGNMAEFKMAESKMAESKMAKFKMAESKIEIVIYLPIQTQLTSNLKL